MFASRVPKHFESLLNSGMKKLIVLLLTLAAISLAAVYLFIPKQLTVSDFEKIQCSLAGANRVISQPGNWQQLWQGDDSSATTIHYLVNDSAFTLNQDTFRITKILQNTLLIDVSGGSIKANSTFALLPLSQDSIAFNWSFETPSSANPVERFKRYTEATHLKKSMELLLKHVKNFLSRNEKVYGFPVQETSTIDTLLVSTKTEFASQPSTGDIYKMIDKLQAYATLHNARQTNAPMMNVTPIDSNRFIAMVALPVDKKLAGNSSIDYKRMVPGKFLTTTTTGGNGTVEATQKSMQLYFQDYRRVSMAIPFMYLVTDRRKESDSSRWVTKLYFPVM